MNGTKETKVRGKAAAQESEVATQKAIRATGLKVKTAVRAGALDDWEQRV